MSLCVRTGGVKKLVYDRPVVKETKRHLGYQKNNNNDLDLFFLPLDSTGKSTCFYFSFIFDDNLTSLR